MHPLPFLLLLATLGLSACVSPARQPITIPPPISDTRVAEAPPPDAASAARNFQRVIADVKPVAESYCRERRPDLNCDFRIVIDPGESPHPNAYHRLDPQTGQPLIGFNSALIMDARNPDELAFVLGHEAGHHIAGHLPRTQTSAMAGALILGTLTAIGGGDAGMIQSAQEIGASVGARTYSQDYELEADAIGAVIAWRAGHDPMTGAAFFSRLPDPGNSFLGSHPPNQRRQQIVARTTEALRSGQLR